ncbi:hypothetical protein PV328_000280 [Microctonus aethiopoides]|uniref:AAA-ATPase-like domain-containing protein n=1 Tax=Microctonus aethiopoides TaxID=144406 RepID=A0AA39KWC5_9HYME|nr:hypothetical protein PV328_000280 [Microctonus aethiopoides]
MESHVAKQIEMREPEISGENLFSNERPILDPLLHTTDYAELINSRMYIDKTMFIKAILEDNDNLVMISAPKLFCKSSNMNMLRKFIEIELNSNGERIELQLDEAGFLKEDQPTSRNFKLFKNKKIFTIKESDGNLIFNKKFFTDHFGRYSIIYVDFNDVRGNTYEEILDSLGEAVRISFLQHRYLKISPILSDDSKNMFSKYIRRYEPLCLLQIINGLKFLSEILREHYRGMYEVYVLIDGFDAPVSNAMTNKSIDEVALQGTINIVQILIDLLLKNNVNIRRALLNTSNHVGTVLTSCAIHKPFLLNDNYWEFCGFTRLEVIYLLKKVGLLKTFWRVERCYGGYNMKSRNIYMDMYCPWSILNYLTSNDLAAYWYDDTFNLLRFSNHQFLRPIIDYLMGGLPIMMPHKVTLENNEIIVLSQIFKKNEIRNDQTTLFLQFLYGNGYLKAERLIDSDMEIKMPNSEIFTRFRYVLTPK